jgi:hypothetical protein
MNWFKKHLNLTWLIVFLILAFFVMPDKDEPKITYDGGVLFCYIILFITNNWVLGEKGRSKIWLLLSAILIWFPLVLRNKKDTSNSIIEKPTGNTETYQEMIKREDKLDEKKEGE